MAREEVGGLILAAGRSRRIGRPKALLPLGDGTPLARTVRACLAGGVRPVHVVVGHAGEVIAAAARSLGAFPVWNDRHVEGQLSSLQAGIRSLPGGLAAFVALPVDHALVTECVVRSLVAAFRAERAGKKIFLPVCGGKPGHPYLLEDSLRAEYLRLPRGATGRDVIRADPSRIRAVPTKSDGILIDIDTPEDYAEVRRRQVDNLL